MKVEIYEDTPKVEEPMLRLALRRDGYSSVCVVAVDADGEVIPGGWLLKFRPDGTLRRFMMISCAVPVQIDNAGRIRIEDK